LLAAEDVTLGVLVGPLQRVGTGTDRLRPYGVEVHVCAPVGRNAIGTHLLETRVLHDVGKLGPSRSAFRDATWHQQQISDDNWLPHFSCKAVGDALRHAAESNPGCQMLVLCGHTHGGGEAQILDNLRVLTGEAEYGRPEVQRILQIA